VNTFVRAVSRSPQGPRSGPGHSVPVHLRLCGPIRPTHGHILISRLAVYTGCPRCAFPPRRHLSGSVLSLNPPSPHAALYDRGEFISCTRSVPSPMTLAFAKSVAARHSQNSHHPFPMGGWFRGFTGSLFRCGRVELLAPCTDPTRYFPQPTGTFTPELPPSRSPFSSSGITTVVTERFLRWDFHPLENQLASLHRLLHPLLHAGLSRRTNIPSLKTPRGRLGRRQGSDLGQGGGKMYASVVPAFAKNAWMGHRQSRVVSASKRP